MSAGKEQRRETCMDFGCPLVHCNVGDGKGISKLFLAKALKGERS